MAPTTFSDLPPEMVRNVFAFVRQKPDQGAICLVSRAWKDHMAPMMWEDFETDLDTVSPQSMVTLLHPRSGILSHVRYLTIHGTKKGEDRLKLVVAAIPRDRIRGFYTFINLDTLTWYLLLLSQRNIQWMWDSPWSTSLDCLGSSDLDSGEHHKSMGSLLPEVSFITLDIQAKEASIERVFNGIESVSRYCPKIKDLALIDRGVGPVSGNSETSLSALFNYRKEASLFSNLTELHLSHLNIAMPGEQTLCKNFNLSKLRSLQIRECDYLIPFLEGLSSFYIDCTGQLDGLIILLPEILDQPLETIQAMGRLLKNCPKLQSLNMDFRRHGPIAKNCILAHCQTLISLQITFGRDEWGDTFSEYMTSILEACTKLERLAIDMPTLDAHAHDIPGFKAGSSFPADFADMLTVISKTTTIRAFRIFTVTKHDFWDATDDGNLLPMRHTTLLQVLMQNLANQIMRFMVKQGSNLKILSFKPAEVDEELPGQKLIRDGNGHRWPEYHYCRGHATDITGTSVVIAHPLRNIALEFPGYAEFLD